MRPAPKRCVGTQDHFLFIGMRAGREPDSAAGVHDLRLQACAQLGSLCRGPGACLAVPLNLLEIAAIHDFQNRGGRRCRCCICGR